jgi:hypothetical protein
VIASWKVVGSVENGISLIRSAKFSVVVVTGVFTVPQQWLRAKYERIFDLSALRTNCTSSASAESPK